MFQEFKKFALRGNVLELAVGVIIGGAFGKIVSSLVNDIIMPILGIFTGKINLTALKFVIPQKGNAPELSIKIGQFLQTTLDFLLVAFSIFIVIKLLDKFKKKEEEKTPEVKVSREEELLAEIRDLLKDKK